MHLETMDKMVAYRQQRVAEEVAIATSSRFWHDFRIQVGQALIRLGEALDDRCREQMAPVAGRPVSTTVRHA